MASDNASVAGSRRFEAIRHLGSGGMGSVFEAFDRQRQAHVALKTLQQPSPSALLYLKNEFRALQDVRHDNLVQLLELVEEDGRFFVAMELVVGSQLLSYLRPGQVELGVSGVSETRPVQRGESASARTTTEAAPAGPAGFDEPRLRGALAQLAQGLLALHERGKVHRDVKPSNVLVTDAGRVVLVDFGLTLDLTTEAASGRRAQAIGTPAFMAPEQAAGQAITGAADWYSFGVVLYLALTGALPFRGAEPERQKLRSAPPSALTLNPHVPADLAELAGSLLDPDPSRRPDGRRVLARLDAAARHPAPMVVTPFLGRQQELAELSSAFADSRERCVLSLVVGDSGLGKSALARELLLRIGQREPQALLLSARCYERELVPYKAFDGIIDSLSYFLRELSPAEAERLLPESARLLTRVFPVLAGVPALAGEASEPELEPQAMRSAAFAALRALLTRLAEQRPILLYVDDLQWADADSHHLLSDLLREPGAPRLHLLATLRPILETAEHPLARLCSALGSTVRRLSLTPLPLEQACALAQSVLGHVDAELSLAIAREAAGLPLFVQALAEHAREGGSHALSTLRLEDALLARVERLEPQTRRLLELVVVAEAPLQSATATVASALAANQYAASIGSLRVARLVRTSASSDTPERVEPYHDRIRETVLARLEVDTRRRHHHALAVAIQGSSTGFDALALVRHLEGAERLAEAAEQAELAAERAERALAFEQASELYQTALRLGRFDEQRAQRLRLALAEALTNAGRAVDAGRAYLEVAQGAEPQAQLEYRRHAADHLLRSGHLLEGSSVLSDVLREFGTDLGSQRGALFTMLSQRALLALRGLTWRERTTAQVPIPTRRRIEAYHAVGVSFALVDTVRGAAFEVQALRLALDAGDPKLLARTLVMEAGYEGASGARGLRRTGRLLAEVDRIIERAPDPYIVAARTMIQGFLDYHAGLFEVAARNLTVMEHEFSRLRGCYFERAFCHCFRLICLRNAGNVGELVAGFEGWVREAERRGDRFTEASLRFNLSGVWLARDQPDEALRDLLRVSWMPPASGYHVQHWYEQQARAEIALYTGRASDGLTCFREQLQALSRSFILRMRLHRCHAQWLLGRLLLADDQGPLSLARQRELRTLIARLTREALGTARTWAPLLQAGLEQRLGRTGPAIVALEQALLRAREHGLEHCEHAAAFRLGQLLGGDDGAEHLRRATTWGRQQGIVRPERLFQSWTPGCD